MARTTLIAGYPDRYPNVYRRVGLRLGDMTVYVAGLGPEGSGGSAMIVRNIEMSRAKESGRAEAVYCPEDLAPESGLSGHRDTAFAQAAAELLRRHGIDEVVGDAMLPLLFVDVLAEAGINVLCDRTLGLMDRRRKSEWEIEQLREAQRHTEEAIRRARDILADAEVGGEGGDTVLHWGDEPLTSARLRSELDIELLRRGFACPADSIVAGGLIGADCHHRGEGLLRVDEPIILDVFPVSKRSGYWGDCTRTLVRGTISTKLADMHRAVVDAKAAAFAACRAGATGAEVHDAVIEVFIERGYLIGLPIDEEDPDVVFYPHGTGHGIGLETHEPPLLDPQGEELVEGDVVTIEPALYCKTIGGVRVEDMAVVRADGCENLNTLLPEALWWD